MPDVTSYQESLIKSQEYLAGFDSFDELVDLTVAELEALSVLATVKDEEARSMEELVGRDEEFFVRGDLEDGFDLQRKLADQRGADLSSSRSPRRSAARATTSRHEESPRP